MSTRICYRDTKRYNISQNIDETSCSKLNFEGLSFCVCGSKSKKIENLMVLTYIFNNSVKGKSVEMSI